MAVSREVNSATVLLASLFAFTVLGSYLSSRLCAVVVDLLGRAATFRIEPENIYNFFYEVTGTGVMLILPFMVIITVAGLLTNLLQTRFLFSLKALKPGLDKINPIQGVKKLFSLRSFVELLKSIFKMILIAYPAYIVIRGEYAMLSVLADLDPRDIGAYALTIMLRILLYTTAIFTVLAFFDLLYQRYDHEKKLKMSKEEVKEEHKLREGDPLVKARVRSIQREVSRRRMISAVKEADVVVTNPTHLAVALEYSRDKMGAPRVVAKGAGFLAERIKEIARSNSIPILERKPLARLLYKTVDVGREIPEELYKAIAEILAYVYRIKHRSLVPQTGRSRS